MAAELEDRVNTLKTAADFYQVLHSTVKNAATHAFLAARDFMQPTSGADVAMNMLPGPSGFAGVTVDKATRAFFPAVAKKLESLADKLDPVHAQYLQRYLKRFVDQGPTRINPGIQQFVSPEQIHSADNYADVLLQRRLQAEPGMPDFLQELQRERYLSEEMGNKNKWSAWAAPRPQKEATGEQLVDYFFKKNNGGVLPFVHEFTHGAQKYGGEFGGLGEIFQQPVAQRKQRIYDDMTAKRISDFDEMPSMSQWGLDIPAGFSNHPYLKKAIRGDKDVIMNWEDELMADWVDMAFHQPKLFNQHAPSYVKEGVKKLVEF